MGWETSVVLEADWRHADGLGGSIKARAVDPAMCKKSLLFKGFSVFFIAALPRRSLFGTRIFQNRVIVRIAFRSFQYPNTFIIPGVRVGSGIDQETKDFGIAVCGQHDRRQSAFDPDFVYLDKDAASFLVNHKILLVGIDSPSVDAFSSSTLPVHKILLDQGIVILENANLQDVPPDDYQLICLPLKLDGLDGSPVRAILCRE